MPKGGLVDIIPLASTPSFLELDRQPKARTPVSLLSDLPPLKFLPKEDVTPRTLIFKKIFKRSSRSRLASFLRNHAHVLKGPGEQFSSHLLVSSRIPRFHHCLFMAVVQYIRQNSVMRTAALRRHSGHTLLCLLVTHHHQKS